MENLNKKHRIAAVVVWFNPSENEESNVSNIKSYSSFFEKVFIVDNSQNDNATVAARIENSVYIRNCNVNGIAGALNLGAQTALDQGFGWILTMDQDSKFDGNVIAEYLFEFQKAYAADDKAVAYTLVIDNKNKNVPLLKQIRFKILSPVKRFVLRRKNLPKAGYDGITADRSISYTDCFIITSGNIVKLSAWNDVGKYDDYLFIDCVDFDFAKKILCKGYKIVKFNWLAMNHEIGVFKKSLFRHMPLESDFRLFYIFRNMMIMKHRYPDEKKFNRLYNYWVQDNLIFNVSVIKNFRIFMKAKKEYKKYICEQSKGENK